MKVIFRLGILLVLVSASISGPALAGPPNFISEEAKTVDGGRAVQVLVAQSEIQSNINQSHVAVAAGGGLLMVLIDAAIEAERAKQAEIDITQIREALAGFDADALAQANARGLLDTVPWLQPSPVTFGKDSTPVGKSTTLDNSGAQQVAFLEYTYDVSSEFDAVRVALKIQFARRDMPPSKSKKPKPELRLEPKNLAYSQTITSVISLPNRSVTSTAVIHVTARNGAGKNIDKSYRGGVARILWWGGASEAQSGIDDAISRALDSAAVDLRQLCKA
jgi:hypothetical protein